MYPYRYYPNPYPVYRPEDVYPPVEIDIFQQSLSTSQSLLQHGMTLINGFSSEAFIQQFMNAAQAGKREEVHRIIQTIGVPIDIETSFNPSGITFTLRDNQNDSPCCRLKLYLTWGRSFR
ncbi:hypothetical protein CR203_11480 [Salipaludibacillus neizhouensis]|uniref:Uncharacterized protein n=1 Tax=Salipaludibacillus neizhouensis TaxID=885475 RepID=A0A3A9KR20_9BACI|nr:hypothetical protein [Salipaludibacillus neizhouensis]RKL67126.1 hypothetical protein CR203_11480 [Salipaludibacillus neizhouensis]